MECAGRRHLANPSTMKARDFVVFTRTALTSLIVCALYQALAISSVSNAMTTKRFGAAPSRATGALVRTIKRPPQRSSHSARPQRRLLYSKAEGTACRVRHRDDRALACRLRKSYYPENGEVGERDPGGEHQALARTIRSRLFIPHVVYGADSATPRQSTCFPLCPRNRNFLGSIMQLLFLFRSSFEMFLSLVSMLSCPVLLRGWQIHRLLAFQPDQQHPLSSCFPSHRLPASS